MDTYIATVLGNEYEDTDAVELGSAAAMTRGSWQGYNEELGTPPFTWWYEEPWEPEPRP